MRSALVWDIMQRMVVISYRRFGTTCNFYIKGPRNPNSDFFNLEYKTDRLSRNVAKNLPLHAAECRVREQISVSTHVHSVAQWD